MAADLPTKKQKELMSFVDGFIKGNGYSPTYREIMRGLGYKSVSTVAIHVDNLITKGFLAKKDNSARSVVIAGMNTHVNVDAPYVKSSDKPQVDIVAALDEKLADVDLSPEDKDALARVKKLFETPS